MKIFLLSTIFILIFTGCSSKKFFEPKQTNGSLEAKEITMPSFISSINAKGATLENFMVLDEIGIRKNKLPEGFYFINNVNGQILAANKSKEILFVDSNTTFKFKSNVIAASFKDDILALVFSNNSIGLYDTKNKIFKLKKYFEHSYLNDTRIAMPIFLDKIILFPTLDGQIVVVDKMTNKLIRTISIDPKNEVKNIILLEAIDNIMIAASPGKIFVLNQGNVNAKEFFIQSYILDKKFIYIASLDGTIYQFDLQLNLINKKKFKFAKFQSLAIGEYIYAIESQGYVVRLSKDFKETKIFTFPFEEDEKMFSSKNRLYLENKLLILK